MKNKKVKIGVIILSSILLITLFAGLMLKKNQDNATVTTDIETTGKVKESKTDKEKTESEKKDTSTESAENKEAKTEKDKGSSEPSGDAHNALVENNNDKVENTTQTVTENIPKPSTDTPPESSGGNNEKPEPAPTPEPVKKYVTMSITCNTILNNMDKVSEGKKDIIPSNGVILGETKFEIKDGDTVFDVLLRETRNKRIHMDFVESPVYGSTYIKGISNIYEFDAGDLSGWMYCVNGVFPNYGCSNYELKDGDVIQWKYTCDLGNDL